MGIGAILQNLLKEKNRNVNEVSVATGVSPSTLYSIIKRDSMSANIQDLYKVAHYLGVSLDYFYAGVNAPLKQKSASPLPDEALQVAADYNTLDQHGRRVVRVVLNEELVRIEL